MDFCTDYLQKVVSVDDVGTEDTRGRAIIMLVEPGLCEGPEGLGAEILVPASRNDKHHFVGCSTRQKVLRL